ncbi:hypothetical protein GCM10023322_80390 [Rugosimonospora acidiphila]|uniref:FAD/NAD(P)-binding domain-containing protein n=1 Tax=Rugosimonospora acidiphila TaxID=556531 RepID=A0ABP9SU34_9ACTN
MSTKVVIVGAGYAGVSAAERLARSDVRVTAVNQCTDFVERIRPHRLTAGNHTATVALTAPLPPLHHARAGHGAVERRGRASGAARPTRGRPTGGRAAGARATSRCR